MMSESRPALKFELPVDPDCKFVEVAGVDDE